MEIFILIATIICLLAFLVITIKSIIFIKKNENVDIAKIRTTLKTRIIISIVLMVLISVLNITYIILRLK